MFTDLQKVQFENLFSFVADLGVSGRSNISFYDWLNWKKKNYSIRNWSLSSLTILKMKKFSVLERSQNFMTRLAISSHRLAEPTNEFFTRFMAYHITFLLYAFSVTHWAVVYKYWPDLSLVLHPFAMSLAGLQCGGVYLSIGLQMKNIKKLHNELQAIVDKGMGIFAHSNLLYHNIFSIELS